MHSVDLYAPGGVTQFKGYVLEARYSGQATPIGVWVVTDSNNQKYLACSGAASAVTHPGATLKTATSLNWTAPAGNPTDTVVI